MKRRIIGLFIACCILMSLMSIATPAHAQPGLKTLTISVKINASTGHFYFSPTFPACIPAFTAENITLANKTGHTVVLTLNAQPYATLKSGKSISRVFDFESTTIYMFTVLQGLPVNQTAQVFVSTC